MPEKEIIYVKQGVWIDEQWLQKAGLGPRVQIESIPGEIRIHSVSALSGEKKPSQKGWNAFRTLGDDALTGCLENASTSHDRYLYGKKL